MNSLIYSFVIALLVQLAIFTVAKNVDLSTVNVDENNRQHLLATFHDFMREYKKVYTSREEFDKRFSIFIENMKEAARLQEKEKGTATYGVTRFSDMTKEEFNAFLGFKRPERVGKRNPARIPDIEIPKEFDWRHFNVVTEVKNQKHCGSCWAFSAVGNMECAWAIKTKQLLSLSEQQLVDCDENSHGCFGGWMEYGFEAVIKEGGIETEDEYPYKARDMKCALNETLIKAKISSYVDVLTDEHGVARWLVENGPVSAALNAKVMMHYTGGISHPDAFECPVELNHGILIVGYGVEKDNETKDDIPFWIIKNSWSANWGEEGYYRLYRGGNVCGINTDVSTSIA